MAKTEKTKQNPREYWGNLERGLWLLNFLHQSPNIPAPTGNIELEGETYIVPSLNHSVTVRRDLMKRRYYVAFSPDSEEHVLYSKVVHDIGFKLPTMRRPRSEVPQELPSFD